MSKLLRILLGAFMLTGCATQGGSIFAPPVRSVEKDVFYSDKDPKITIEVDSRLPYRGKFVKQLSQSWPGWADNVKYTIYAFASVDSEKRIDRGLVIIFAKLADENSFWTSQCSHVRDGKYITLANGKYCAIDRPNTGRNLFGGFYDHIIGEGLEPSRYYFQKYMTLYRQKRNVSFRILYMERIRKPLFHKFRAYYSGSESMREGLRHYLSEFDKRCMSYFEITEH
jgi:hypothetical protein